MKATTPPWDAQNKQAEATQKKLARILPQADDSLHMGHYDTDAGTNDLCSRAPAETRGLVGAVTFGRQAWPDLVACAAARWVGLVAWDVPLWTRPR